MVKTQIIDKFATLTIAAFGLVAALAWNSAIQAIFKAYIPGEGVTAKLIYALSVTVIAVLLTLWIGYIAAKANHFRNPLRSRKKAKK